VILAWDPSTDPLIAGYSLYYGGASQTYTNEISVGLVTTATLSGLAEGNTYYFAATTYNELGLESPFSSELVYLVPTLSAANQPPTLNAINNLTIIENSSSQTVSLSGITSGSANENQVLAVSAASSDTSLVSNPTVNYTSPNTTGSLTFTSAPNANGTAIITVIVSDGQTRNNTVIRTFTVTVVVDTADYLVINPLTNQVAMTGQIITFSTTANKGGSVKYQWKFNGTNLPLATASSLTLSDVTTNQAGIYSVTASAIGHVSTIQAATLTVTSPAAAQLAPTAQASGPPPNVVPCMPGCMAVATRLVVRIAPSGSPAASGFATVAMSGRIP